MEKEGLKSGYYVYNKKEDFIVSGPWETREEAFEERADYEDWRDMRVVLV